MIVTDAVESANTVVIKYSFMLLLCFKSFMYIYLYHFSSSVCTNGVLHCHSWRTRLSGDLIGYRLAFQEAHLRLICCMLTQLLLSLQRVLFQRCSSTVPVPSQESSDCSVLELV